MAEAKRPEPEVTPAETVTADPRSAESGPCSSDTCGTFPAHEVAETYPGTGTDPQARGSGS